MLVLVEPEPPGWRGGGGIEARGLMRNWDRAGVVAGVLGDVFEAVPEGGKDETDGAGEGGTPEDRVKYDEVGVLGRGDGEYEMEAGVAVKGTESG